MIAGAEVLLSAALEVVPRALGFCDREPASSTYGCCDRAYWHYRLSDVANARFQESALLFALAHSMDIKGNRFHGQRKLVEWARGAWRHWLAKRNADGSASELYPHERCFCATAFTAAAFIETVQLLGGRAAWEEELRSAGATFRWLAREQSRETANQMAASLQALSAYATVTGSPEFLDLAQRRRGEFLALEKPSGRFPEYGGFDAGYQSITLSCLARSEAHSPDSTVADALRRAAAALGGHLDAEGRSAPGENSRGTQFVYPYGLVYLHRDGADPLISGLLAESALRPGWMDDRYCVPMAIDYLFAVRELNSCS